MSTRPSPTDVVKAVYAAFGAGDGPGILGRVAPDTVWTLHGPTEHPYAGTFRGPAEVGRFLGLIAGAVEVLEFAVDEWVAAGDRVVVLGHERVRWRSSGREAAHAWVHAWRVVGEKVASFDEWYDTASALAASRR